MSYNRGKDHFLYHQMTWTIFRHIYVRFYDIAQPKITLQDQIEKYNNAQSYPQCTGKNWICSFLVEIVWKSFEMKAFWADGGWGGTLKVGPLLGLVITPWHKPGSKETRARGFLTSTLAQKHKGKNAYMCVHTLGHTNTKQMVAPVLYSIHKTKTSKTNSEAQKKLSMLSSNSDQPKSIRTMKEKKTNSLLANRIAFVTLRYNFPLSQSEHVS